MKKKSMHGPENAQLLERMRALHNGLMRTSPMHMHTAAALDALYAEYSAVVRAAARNALADVNSGLFVLQTAYRMVGQVRDARSMWGGASRAAAHEMVAAWALLPKALQPLGGRLACDALEAFVDGGHDGSPPYGCWRDVRDVCERVRVRSGNNTQHSVVLFAVRMMCERLVADRDYYYEARAAFSSCCPMSTEARANASARPLRGLSTCAKWAPREASPRHGWLFRLLAKRYYLAEGGLELKLHYEADRGARAHEAGAHEAVRGAFWTRERLGQAKARLRRLTSSLCGRNGLNTAESALSNGRLTDVAVDALPADAAAKYARALLNAERADGSVRLPKKPRPKVKTTKVKVKIEPGAPSNTPSALDALQAAADRADGAWFFDRYSDTASDTASESACEADPSVSESDTASASASGTEVIDLTMDDDDDEQNDDYDPDDRVTLLGPVDAGREALANSTIIAAHTKSAHTKSAHTKSAHTKSAHTKWAHTKSAHTMRGEETSATWRHAPRKMVREARRLGELPAGARATLRADAARRLLEQRWSGHVRAHRRVAEYYGAMDRDEAGGAVVLNASRADLRGEHGADLDWMIGVTLTLQDRLRAPRLLVLNGRLVDAYGPGVTSLPERVAAVYRAVRAGGETTDRALFAALPRDTLRLVDAHGAWTNMATVGAAGAGTGFAADCVRVDALVEGGLERVGAPVDEGCAWWLHGLWAGRYGRLSDVCRRGLVWQQCCP